MQITHAKYRNFGPFDTAEVDFSLPGITVIEGETEMAGTDSNGAGKSAILDGVAWCLYGRALRQKFTHDDVVRYGASDGCCVDVTVEAEETIHVRRYRKDKEHKSNVYLWVGGDDITRGTNQETDKAIVEALGADFQIFTNSVAFGTREDIKSLFSATDADRKKLFDAILGLDRYAEAEEAAKAEAKELNKKITECDRAINGFDARLEEKRGFLSELEDSEDTDDTNLRPRYTVRLQATRRELERCKIKREQLESEWDEAQDELEERKQQWREEVEQINKKKRELESNRREAEQDRTRAQTKIDGIDSHIEKMQGLAESTCPTCSQTVTKETADGIIEELRKNRSAYKEEVSKAQHLIDRTVQSIEGLIYPDEPQSKELRALEVEFENLTQRQNSLQQRAEQLRELIRELEARESEDQKKQQRKQIQADTDRLQREREEKAEERKTLANQLEDVEFWAEGFGARGIRSFLIEQEMPRISEYATYYAQRLLGEGTVVRLNATSTTKSNESREKISMDVAIPGAAQSYPAASTGQKKRLDMAVVLALRDIVSNRAHMPFNQLFADELFDGLDRTGTEVVGELLREVSETGPVTVITHTPQLRDVADRCRIVYHNGEYATLREYVNV